MQELNLPHHVIEAFEKRWARKRQQKVATWRDTRSPARTRTDSGVPVERRSRRPRPIVFRQECVVSRPPAYEAPSKPVKRRRRVHQTLSLQDRLAQQARNDRDRLGACRPAESGKSCCVMHGAPRARLK